MKNEIIPRKKNNITTPQNINLTQLNMNVDLGEFEDFQYEQKVGLEFNYGNIKLKASSKVYISGTKRKK